MKIKALDFEIRKIDYRLLQPIQGNLKDLSKENYKRLKKSFTEKGLFVPSFVWDDGGEYRLLDGHGRERLWKNEHAVFVDSEGRETYEVPCLIIPADSLEDAKQKLLIVSSQYQGITQEGFEEFAHDLDPDWIQDTVHFDNLYEDRLFRKLAGKADADAIPEMEGAKGPITKRGDIWQLGAHRLMCGSSLELADVDRLCAGVQSFQACITDPPYSVSYQKASKERRQYKKGQQENQGIYDTYNENDDARAILNFMGLVRSDVLIFSYALNAHFFQVADSLREHGFEFFKELVWVKDNFAFWAGAKYQSRHEPVLICIRKGFRPGLFPSEEWPIPGAQYDDGHESVLIAVKKGKILGGDVPANASTVLEYAKPAAHKIHPTAKPVDLWAFLVRNHVKKGGLLYEPFGGSGTSIIAAEMAGVTCYAMELSEVFCDCIVQRWEEFTGGKARRVSE